MYKAFRCAILFGMADKIEIIINACYGGFGLTEEAFEAYKARASPVPDASDEYAIPRHDPVLVSIVKEMGDRAWDLHAKLEIRHIPAQYTGFYRISEYDGLEHIEILYNKYKVHAAKAMLADTQLTLSVRVARALAVLSERLSNRDED
jgi:hypothetical protein